MGRVGFSAADQSRIAEAEASHQPFLVWRDEETGTHLVALDGPGPITIGRRSTNDVALVEDELVSRTHARLERLDEDWLVFDSGISRNGTFVNGSRVAGHKLLVDSDRMRFGATVVEFRNPRGGHSLVTHASAAFALDEQITATQRRILIALCRPLRERGPYAAPASNPQIAREVFLGVDAVKAHLRELYRRFDIDLPQNQKRARLAEQALELGLAGEP